MFVIFLVLAAVLCVSSHESHISSKIALGVMGKANELLLWHSMRQLLNRKNDTVLFLFTYDKPIDSEYCSDSVVCLHKPGTTWTSGRNELVRGIADYHAKQLTHFKYWFLADEDMAVLTGGSCRMCPSTDYPANSAQLAACCYDAVLDMLLAPEVQWAIVNFVTYTAENIDYISFSHTDCSDVALSAHHHSVVPVALPYVELSDRISWWESGGMQHQVAAACFPGYSVYSNIIQFNDPNKGAHHAPYQRGRSSAAARQVMEQVFRPRGLIPNPMRGDQFRLQQGNCVWHDYKQLGLQGSYEPKIETPSGGGAALRTLWKTDAWLELPSFKKCLEGLRPRYNGYLSSGNLTALDGEVFAAGQFPLDKS